MSQRLPRDLAQLAGTTVSDHFRVVSHVGSGKRGHVFQAEGPHGVTRALKFIPLAKLGPHWEQEAFKAHLLEGQPNTVRFHQFFYHAGKYGVMVFDFVEGSSLLEWIRRKRLTIGEVERILYNLLFFRQDCLDKRVRHGDLHPGNVILRRASMGAPRGYEVMITDFGIGYTGAALEPKDDLTQIGRMATAMLQSVRREDLDDIARLVYAELCRGPALKTLRESSPLERGDERAAIASAVEELQRVRSRALAPEAGRGVQARFGDYLAGEQLGNRWDEWKDLFVATFPGYADVVSRNITVLTGTRGCGKTMVFRRLSKLLNLQIGPVDRDAADAFTGFYLNMNDVGDAFLFGRRVSLTDDLAARVIQFFHLSLLSEIVRVAVVARDKASESQRSAFDSGNQWLFDVVTRELGADRPYPGPNAVSTAMTALVDQARDEVRRSRRPPRRLASLAENDWLQRLVPGLQSAMPWVGDRPVYFFLDDYSLPRVHELLQTVINSVIFRRSENHFFKVSTESPSTFHRRDYSGKELQDTDDFELTDLGSVTIHQTDRQRQRFLDEVFRRRFARETRFRGRSLVDVLGDFQGSWTALAREIRAGRRAVYHGRKVFVNMWSGDTRAMVRIALSLLEELPSTAPAQSPLSREAQDKVFRRIGGEFLHLLEACSRTKRQGTPRLPRHITSWGKHLVRIAEAFKEVALHELRTRQGGRQGRDEPKQAFRIEIVDRFSLAGLEQELYEDLVRYGVFLRDDRGKSIRGAIIPRLYLRRLLIPYFTLTFSKVDNVAVKASDFKALLVHPEDFATRWKRHRNDFDTGQKELFES